MLGRTLAAVGFVLTVGLLGPAPATAGQAPAPSPEPAPEPGLGKSGAQLMRIEPTSAGLSFGVVFGPTAADHRNHVARATARSTDFGIVGTALTGEPCDGSDPLLEEEQLPQTMRADSREPASAEERSVQEGLVVQSVQATPEPFARATSRLQDTTIPGVLTVAGAVNETTSGIDDDGIRVARADVEVGVVDLLGGLVRLGNLRWTAEHRGDAEPVGRFSIGSARVAGTPIPTEDPAAVIEAVNGVTGLLGVSLEAPGTRVVGEDVFVDPLVVGIVPNQQRDSLAGALLGAVQPVREDLFGALIEADCANAALITVLDILVGSVSGGGSLTVSFGGADAGTGVPDEFEFPTTTPRPPASAPTATTPPAASAAPTSAAPAPAAPERVDAEATPVAAAPTPAAEVGELPDGALEVGLVTLLLGALLMEGDRRKMRRAERDAPDSGSEPL